MPFKNPHPLYSVWQSMLRRCYTPTSKQFHDYGGRGIRVCDRWRSFHAFVEDMGERPPNTSLDRIDNDANYEPKNCKWSTRKEQQRNQRTTRFVTIEGVTYKAVELAEKSGLKTDSIVERAKLGLPLSEVISPKKRKNLSGLALGGLAFGAKSRAKIHCLKGHPFDEQNTSVTSRGWRRCKRCHADRQLLRAQRARQSQEQR